MAGPLPWLLGGAALIGGALYLRSRATAQAGTGGMSTCEALAAAGLPSGLCESAGSIVDAVGNAFDAITQSNAELEADNVKKNGAAVKSLHPAMPRVVASTGGYATRSTTIEHANGCQPYKSALGWTKCAQGTHDMTAVRAIEEVSPLSGKLWGQGAKHGGDPLTFSDDKWRRSAKNNPAPYPVPVPAGFVAAWSRGVPVPRYDVAGAITGQAFGGGQPVRDILADLIGELR